MIEAPMTWLFGELPPDKIIVMPRFKTHTISCVENYRDDKSQTCGLRIRSKTYLIPI